MERSNGSSQHKIQVDYANTFFSEAFRELKPVIYVNGVSYCCMSGKSIIEGIFGFGNTPEEAVEEWEKALGKKKGDA